VLNENPVKQTKRKHILLISRKFCIAFDSAVTLTISTAWWYVQALSKCFCKFVETFINMVPHEAKRKHFSLDIFYFIYVAVISKFCKKGIFLPIRFLEAWSHGKSPVANRANQYQCFVNVVITPWNVMLPSSTRT